jgi:phospholipase C
MHDPLTRWFEADNPNELSFRNFARFEQDVAEGKLAHYNFINPAFIEHWNYLRQGFEAVSSQHAPCDVRPGEALIARVYNALRRSKLWENTLLVILYDEHGGFYDHVPPPTSGVPNPDGLVSKDPPFDFTRLGPRTPAILISPRLPRQLDSTVYEHSSLLAP